MPVKIKRNPKAFEQISNKSVLLALEDTQAS